MDSQHHGRMCGNLADGKPLHSLENQTVEILIGLVLFGLIIMLFPYILAGLMAVVAIFVAIIAAFVFTVKWLFNR